MSILKNHDTGGGMTEADCAALKPGARVLHAIFGEGTVEGQYPKQRGRSFPAIGILFDRHGLKELAINFCSTKLKRLPDPTDVV